MEWTLNWLWQGGVLAAVTLAALRCSRSSSASARHAILFISLAIVVIMPLGAWLSSTPAALPAPGFTRAPLVRIPETPGPWRAALVGTWAGLSLLLVARLLWSLAHVRRVKASTLALPAVRERRLTTWMRLRDRGRPVRLATSESTPSPGAFGFGAAVIVFPPTVADRLPDDVLDRVVVHEYAHLQRRDDFACLAQGLLCAVAWWHPAVWWLGRALTLEREAACDDWAVQLTGSPKQYAACLTTLASLPWPRHADAVPGMLGRRSQLSHRIARLLDPARSRRLHYSPTGLAAAAILLAAGAGIVISVGPDVIGRADTLVKELVSRDLGRGLLAPAPILPASLTPRQPTMVRSRPTPVVQERTEVARPPDASAGETVRVGPDTDAPPVAAERAPLDAAPVAALAESPEAPHSGWTVGLRAGAPRDRRPATIDDNPWSDLATAGSTIGQGSRRAASATAGFFTRAGKSVAAAF